MRSGPAAVSHTLFSVVGTPWKTPISRSSSPASWPGGFIFDYNSEVLNARAELRGKRIQCFVDQPDEAFAGHRPTTLWLGIIFRCIWGPRFHFPSEFPDQLPLYISHEERPQ